MNGQYLVVKSLKSGIKLNATSKFYFSDIIFILACIFIGFNLQDFIYEPLYIPFMIYLVIFAVILVSPSKFNPGKKYYQSLYLFIIAVTSIYLPLQNETQKSRTAELKEELQNEKENI